MEAALQQALAARGLAVSYFPGKGRGLLTTRDFSLGDTVITEDSYASTPYDFSSPSCCDRCFASNNIKRCSSCKIACYCGIICQKKEWKLHQIECKALNGLSNERRKNLMPCVRLMLRLLLRKELQTKKVISATPTDNYDLVKALVSHTSEYDADRLVLSAQLANLVKQIIPQLEIDLKEVAENFARLSCNALTICDSDLRPLGTGLYPVISIINHSCEPNTVIVFEGQTAIVRATQDVKKDTEILISYTDIGTTTSKRQMNLLDQYFFSCACQRCCNTDPQNDATLEGYRCISTKCDSWLLHDHQKNEFRCQGCGLFQKKQEIERAESKVKRVSEMASKQISEHNYAKAIVSYKTLEQLQSKLYHSHSLQLMRTREELMKILMELNDWNGALHYCRLKIPNYQRLYPGYHPVLGLQYYVCGNLEWSLGLIKDAVSSLTKAVDVLCVTHGTSSPFVTELLSKLEEARAQANHGRH